MNRLNNQPSWVFLFPTLIIAVIAYLIPWVVHPTTALTLGAYDLAEWVSLRPDLSTSLLLRLQPAILTLIFALNLPKDHFIAKWWIGFLAVVILILAQLPPLDFFRSATGDPNYQQQFIIVIATALGFIFILTGLVNQFRVVIILVLCVAGLISTFYSVLAAINHLEQFSISVELGFGVRILALCYMGIMLIYLMGKQTTR